MRTRAVLVTAGVLTMAYAGYGILTDPAANPVGILVFLIAVLVGHDAIWMPALLTVGALLTHLVPDRHRTVVRVAAIAAAAVTVVALPLALGFGRSADNPSALPLPYGRNLALVLLAIAAAVAMSVAARNARDRRAVRADLARDRRAVRGDLAREGAQPVRHPKAPVRAEWIHPVSSVTGVGHRVLIVDDDPTVSDVVRRYLERDGCTVRLAADGADGLAAVAAERPDLVVLDLMMPGIDGLEVCRRLRRQMPDLPVVMLTALGEEADRVLGLEVGADDYVTKPFSPRELVLRIRSVLRRAAPLPADPAEPVADGELRLDTARRTATLGGVPLALTVREFDLLEFLVRHPGQAWSRAQLLNKVWGWQFGDHSTVTVHVRRLREKIETNPAAPRRILTVWGVGYRYELGGDGPRP